MFTTYDRVASTYRIVIARETLVIFIESFRVMEVMEVLYHFSGRIFLWTFPYIALRFRPSICLMHAMCGPLVKSWFRFAPVTSSL